MRFFLDYKNRYHFKANAKCIKFFMQQKIFSIWSAEAVQIGMGINQAVNFA